MRKLIMLAAVLLLASIPATAQTSYPSTEIFGGYSYLNTKLVQRDSLHGLGASFAGNPSARRLLEPPP